MNLWLKAHFFFAALFVSCLADALTKEECEPLIKPLPLEDILKLNGRVNLLLGYADHPDFKGIMKLTDSYWANITVTSNNQLILSQMDKLNGTCVSLTVKMSFEVNTGKASMPHMFLEYHFLPTCDSCMLIIVNGTATNQKKLDEDTGVNTATDAKKPSGHAIYLMGKETAANDSLLEHFKKQAHCLGFSGEPDFHYNPEKSFCQEGEGIVIPNN